MVYYFYEYTSHTPRLVVFDLTNMAATVLKCPHFLSVLQSDYGYEALASGKASFPAAAISSPTCQ